MAFGGDDGIGAFELCFRHSRSQSPRLVAITEIPRCEDRIRDGGEEDYQKDRIAASTFASCCLQDQLPGSGVLAWRARAL